VFVQCLAVEMESGGQAEKVDLAYAIRSFSGRGPTGAVTVTTFDGFYDYFLLITAFPSIYDTVSLYYHQLV
jgi:hypothetical protein